MAKIVLTINANNKATESVRHLNKEIGILKSTLPTIQVNRNLTAQINALTKHYKAVADAHAKITANSNKQAIADEKLKQQQSKTALAIAKENTELERQNKIKAQTESITNRTARAKEKDAQSIKLTISQTQKLVKQYADLLNQINAIEKSYKKGTFDKLKNDVSSYFNDVKGLDDSLKSGTITQEDYNRRIIQATASLQGFKTEMATTRTESKNLHGTLKDIVSGFFNFQLGAMLVMKPLQMIRSALSSINETLVKTEDSVIALQRVLPQGSATNGEISSRLYKIAQDYGQTFDNVSQIAENFARTGMSWADTIKATEAAVLALNVAELDATEASEGLISILTQFDMSTAQLTETVDKLNKAADNNPVTTEKLLKALQRTGAAAKNANINLDDTIGIITTLSKATNRSGENLGTAINSLIQFSSKASSLDTFAKLGGSVETAVEKYRAGAGSILEIWEKLSEVIKNRQGDAESILGGDLFGDEEWAGLNAELKAELGESYADITDIYDTASTFRKNYFIALLNDMENVKKVSGEIANANGYSQDENQKYLDTYTAKLNSLQAQWQTLIADENGILAIKKAFVDIGSAVLTFTNSIGGLRTVLIAVGSTIGSIFGGKIIGSAITNIGKLVTSFRTGEKSFKGLLSTFGNAINPIKKFQSATQALRVAQEAQIVATEKQNLADSIRNGNIVEGITLEQADTAAKNAQTVATNAAATATKAWGLAIQTALGWIGLLVTGVSMVVGIVQQVEADRQARIEQQRREREETIEQWEAIKDEAIAFAELNEQYNELKNNSSKTAEQEKEFLSVQESIVKTLGYKAVALKKLQEGTEEYQKKLEELTQAEIKRYAMQAQSAANAAEENFLSDRISFSLVGKEKLGGYFGKYQKDIQDDLNKNNVSLDIENFQKNGWQTSEGSFSLLEIYRKYLEAMYDNGLGDTKEYSDAFKLYDEARKQSEEYLTTQAQNEAWKYLSQNGLPQTQEEIDSIVNTVIKATGATENWRDTIEGVVVELTGFEPPKKGIDDWSNDITKVTGKYDDLISKLEELRDLQKESTEWEEKKLAVMEAEQALENARNEATVRRFNQATGQWEWQTDEKKIAEAEKNLEQAQLNLQEAAYSNIIEQLENETATNESILAILQEVAPLLGADNDFVDAVINAFKDKTGVDITKPAISNFDAAQNYINEKGLKESDREKWTEDKTFEKLFNALTDEEKSKLKGKSYDSGGIANGLGFMAKATAQPETVNDPELTKKILSPVSNAEFNRYVRDMGIMFERSHQYAQTPIIERVGGAVDNRVNNSGQVIMNGVAIGSDKRGNSLDEILSLANIVPNV